MISKIFYYLFLIPLSLLPYTALYLLSDFLFVILHRLVGYRRKVIFSNLQRSFPDKNKEELKIIMINFYRHFCDILIESVKGFTVSEEQLRKRVLIKNPEFTNYYADKGQSIILVGGHYNNWEICVQAFSMYSNHKCIAIYKPLSDTFFNSKLYKSRTLFGLELISMKQTKRSFDENSKVKAIVFGSDQNPSNPKRAHWMNFLNQDTAVLFGVEKYAKEYNWPVVFVSISKVKRGCYEVEYSLITDKPTEQPHGRITESFTKKLEQDIINNPQYWLWSHKRWKHKR